MCKRKSLISSEAEESLSSLTLHLIELLKRDVVIALRDDFFFGDAADHGKIEGTASSIKYRRLVKLLRKSVGLKYNE